MYAFPLEFVFVLRFTFHSLMSYGYDADYAHLLRYLEQGADDGGGIALVGSIALAHLNPAGTQTQVLSLKQDMGGGTSLTAGSARTTMARGASARKSAPCALHWLRACSIWGSSTTTNS